MEYGSKVGKLQYWIFIYLLILCIESKYSLPYKFELTELEI